MSVTLSHFCPTAATLLLQSPRPLAIVDAPEAFPASRDYDGLDGRATWPPLIKPTLLFDLASYSQWERFVLATIDGAPDQRSVWDALRDVSDAVEDLRAWTPDDGPLDARVLQLDQRASATGTGAGTWRLYEAFTNLEAYDRLLGCVPDELRPPPLSPAMRHMWSRVRAASPPPARISRRYVAAKAFAAWSAYDAFGIRTMVAELAIAALVLEVEAARWWTRAIADDGEHADVRLTAPSDAACIEMVRAADWLLVHLVDRSALLAWLAPVEHLPIDPPRGMA